MDMFLLIALYLAIGSIAGFLAGLLGVGGGMIMVPALYAVFSQNGMDDQAMHMAIATSLAVIIPTGCMSAWSHNRKGGIDWALWRRWLPGTVIGVVIGAFVADAMSGAHLRLFFGLLLLALAALMLKSPTNHAHATLPDSMKTMLPAGLFVGLISSMAGVGGATVSVPVMRWLGRPMPLAIGTAAALGVVIAIPGTISFMLLDPPGADIATPWVVGAVNVKAALMLSLASLPLAPVGAMLTHRLPREVLRRVFVGFMILVSLRLLLDGYF